MPAWQSFFFCREVPIHHAQFCPLVSVPERFTVWPFTKYPTSAVDFIMDWVLLMASMLYFSMLLSIICFYECKSSFLFFNFCLCPIPTVHTPCRLKISYYVSAHWNGLSAKGSCCIKLTWVFTKLPNYLPCQYKSLFSLTIRFHIIPHYCCFPQVRPIPGLVAVTSSWFSRTSASPASVPCSPLLHTCN